MSAHSAIVIRSIESHAEYHALEQLQRDVWGLPEVEVVPLHVLITAAKNGGLLFGAFDGDRLAGFVFGFPGLTPEGGLKHCSHMAGVHPAYRDQGLGYALKLAQRERVLAQGMDLITWTFDPLETRNATLNFHKLGAVCNTYLRNLYGDMRDGLNAGLPSDRFQVEWWIGSPRVAERLAARSSGPTGGESIAIPTDFQALKAASMEQALALRLRTRDQFEAAFAAGYRVTDFRVDGKWGYYVMENTKPGEL